MAYSSPPSSLKREAPSAPTLGRQLAPRRAGAFDGTLANFSITTGSTSLMVGVERGNPTKAFKFLAKTNAMPIDFPSGEPPVGLPIRITLYGEPSADAYYPNHYMAVWTRSSTTVVTDYTAAPAFANADFSYADLSVTDYRTADVFDRIYLIAANDEPDRDGNLPIAHDDEDQILAFNAFLLGTSPEHGISHRATEVVLQVKLKGFGPHMVGMLRKQVTMGSGVLHAIKVAIRSEEPVVTRETTLVKPIVTDALLDIMQHLPFLVLTDAEDLASATVTGLFLPSRDPISTMQDGPDDEEDTVHRDTRHAVEGYILSPGRDRAIQAIIDLDSAAGKALFGSCKIGLYNYETVRHAILDVDNNAPNDPDFARKVITLIRPIKATFQVQLGVLLSATNVRPRPRPLTVL